VLRLSAAAAFFAGAFTLEAYAGTAAPPCKTSAELMRLSDPLPNVARRLAAGQAITIVAIGSSSTAGAGASSPDANYPSRLSVELKEQLPGHAVTVINRGVNGEEVRDMLKRFDTGVIAAKPDLVLWQLGTNSLLRHHKFDEHGKLIRVGLKKLRAIGADVVLIDPQYAPKVIARPDAPKMVELLSTIAKQENVDLYRRYDMMKRWHEVDRIGFDTFISPDGLHQNDWSYACMAKTLGQAIAEAAQRPVISASMDLMSDWTP
jgi:lysophospholipase L1-like esterase